MHLKRKKRLFSFYSNRIFGIQEAKGLIGYIQHIIQLASMYIVGIGVTFLKYKKKTQIISRIFTLCFVVYQVPVCIFYFQQLLTVKQEEIPQTIQLARS